MAPRSAPTEPGQITYVREPVPGAGSVYDLCDDEEALAAGLDGGQLEASRSNLGVDCSDDSDEARYQFLDYDGQLHCAGPLRRSDGTFDLDGPEARSWMDPPPGSPLRSFPEDANDASGDEQGLSVRQSSVTVADGVLTGELVNNSGAYQRDIRISARHVPGGELGSASIPFVVLDGEVIPFSIVLATPTTDPEDIRFEIDGTRTEDPPVGRSMYVYISGCWEPGDGQDASDYPGKMEETDDDLAPPEESDGVCTALVQAENSVEAGDVTPDNPIISPMLRIATLDEHDRVLRVADFALRSFGDSEPVGALTDDGDSGVGESGAFVGYFRPTGTVSTEVWAWGAP